MSVAVALCAAIVLSACTAPPAAPADPAAIITERNAAFMAGIAAGDGAAVGALYTESATLMPPGMPRFEGRDAISQFWQGGIAAGIARVELTSDEVVATSADTILERSTARVFNAAGVQIDEGKAVIVWRLVNGEWYMAWDIWNSDGVAPAAPAPTL